MFLLQNCTDSDKFYSMIKLQNGLEIKSNYIENHLSTATRLCSEKSLEYCQVRTSQYFFHCIVAGAREHVRATELRIITADSERLRTAGKHSKNLQSMAKHMGSIDANRRFRTGKGECNRSSVHISFRVFVWTLVCEVNDLVSSSAALILSGTIWTDLSMDSSHQNPSFFTSAGILWTRLHRFFLEDGIEKNAMLEKELSRIRKSVENSSMLIWNF